MKKVYILFICVLILSSILRSLEFSSTPNDIIKHHKTVVNITSPEDLVHMETADVVSIAFDDLNIIKELAQEWVDSGGMLYITAPEKSNEAIASYLSIPKEDTSIYNPLVLVATYIFALGDGYVFGNHWASIPEIQSPPSFGGNAEDAPINPEESKRSFDQKVISLPDAIDKYKTAQAIDAEGDVENAIISREKSIAFMKEAENRYDENSDASVL